MKTVKEIRDFFMKRENGKEQSLGTGQVIGADTPYMLQLDFFLINARVKGGNSGGPVINNGW